MTIRAIRGAIQLLRVQAEPGSAAHNLTTLALAEADALERATKVLARCDVIYPKDVATSIATATSVVRAIAEEAE